MQWLKLKFSLTPLEKSALYLVYDNNFICSGVNVSVHPIFSIAVGNCGQALVSNTVSDSIQIHRIFADIKYILLTHFVPHIKFVTEWASISSGYGIN